MTLKINIYNEFNGFSRIADIENNLTKILTLIKNEDQSNREGNPKDAKKESELVGLIEDFYTQYQSLYALYDRLTGENGKIVYRRTETAGSASLSSSGSESDYFSSDELDRESNHSLRHSSVSDSIKQEHQETSNVAEVKSLRDGDKDMAGSKELEEGLSRQKKELESLNRQKMDLQLKFESKATEAQDLSAKNSELHARISELEALMKTKEEVSGLEMKLQSNESHAASNISELMSQINTLIMEAESLRTQKDEMAAKLAHSRDEALDQLNGLRIQLITMHENLDSPSYKNKELETQMEEKKESISHYLVKIEDLNEQMREQKEDFAARIKDLEMELEIRCSQKKESEKELREKIHEIKQLGDENKALKDRNVELERVMIHTEEEFSTLAKQHESSKTGASMRATALATQVNDLKAELEALREEKNRLEQQNETIQRDYSESITKIFDQGKVISEQSASIERMSVEYEELKMWSKKFRMNPPISERKVEELAEEVRRKLEDNIRLLYRRIRVAEQLHNETKDSYKMTKLMYEDENKRLQEKVYRYQEEEARRLGATVLKLNLKPLEIVSGLEVAARKVEEESMCFVNRVGKMMEEAETARDWIRERKGEMKQLKDKVENLTALLEDKEKQEEMLREKVWKLEARVSKEGGEKLNLMKSVSQLEKKVGRLEKSLKEKDEEVVNLGEMKKEAIRQLCILNDYHRNRCDYLKDLISKIRLTKTMRR